MSFISAPGTSEPYVYRPGGPAALVTELCRFDFDRAKGRFNLASLHPGQSVETVRDRTGFSFDSPDHVPETPAPDARSLALMRGPIADEIAEIYPAFAARLGAS